MNVQDHDGTDLDARFSIVTEDGIVTLLFEARSGSPIKNRDYNLGLETLLSRARDLGVVIQDAELVSRDAMKLPRDERRLVAELLPINLADYHDLTTLRRSIGHSQAKTGRKEGAKGAGNSTKRIALTLILPHNIPASDVETLLAYPMPMAFDPGQGDKIATSNAKASLTERVQAGQGFAPTALRKAIDKHAMAIAQQHFERLGYAVDPSVAATKPYDLSCLKGGKETRVEVKGTTGRGDSVFLTRGEVEHARSYADVILFVVHSIKNRGSNTLPKLDGGKVKIVQDWSPLEEDLVVVTYQYGVPKG